LEGCYLSTLKKNEIYECLIFSPTGQNYCEAACFATAIAVETPQRVQELCVGKARSWNGKRDTEAFAI